MAKKSTGQTPKPFVIRSKDQWGAKIAWEIGMLPETYIYESPYLDRPVGKCNLEFYRKDLSPEAADRTDKWKRLAHLEASQFLYDIVPAEQPTRNLLNVGFEKGFGSDVHVRSLELTRDVNRYWNAWSDLRFGEFDGHISDQVFTFNLMYDIWQKIEKTVDTYNLIYRYPDRLAPYVAAIDMLGIQTLYRYKSTGGLPYIDYHGGCFVHYHR